MKQVRKLILQFVSVLNACLILPLHFGACTPEPQISYAPIQASDFLMTNGEDIKKERGVGETVYLRGVNAGNYLLVEEWMSPFMSSESMWITDHKTLTDTFVERFGEQKTIELWANYRENFWTDVDFKNCVNMGMNVIRLPFSYMNVDPDYYNCSRIDGEPYNFSQLDWFVTRAAEYGLYTILDLHGAYGSQNGQDHSGEKLPDVESTDFFRNEEKQQKTIDLWTAIAKHFNGNPAVAAYDLLNEPGEKGANTSARHWNFYNKLYKAVRQEDKEHIVIFETMYEAEHFPPPGKFGWENCMYSVHNYADKNLESIKTLNQMKLNNLEEGGFHAPLHMGEFNCFHVEEGWKYLLNLLNEHGWHWTSWSYKLNTHPIYPFEGWGIYYSKAETIYYDTDSYEEIMTKIPKIRTDDRDTVKFTFESGNTLENVMREGCLGGN